MKHLSVKLLSLLLLTAMLCSLLPSFALAGEATSNPENTTQGTPFTPGTVATVQDDMGVTSYATRADSTTTTESYVLVRSPKNLTAGEYLIVASATGPYSGSYSHYVMTTREDDTYMIMQGAGQSFSTLPTTLQVDTSIRSRLAWTLQGDASGLTLQAPAGTYLTATPNVSSLSLGTQGTTWTATYDANSKSFTLAADNRYLALRTDVGVVGTNGMCGFATSVPGSGDANIHLYKKVNTSQMEYLTMYHSLDLGNDISLNFILPTSQLKDFEQLRLEIDRPIYQGNTLVDWETTLVEPTLVGDYYYFTVASLTAIQMNDVLQAVLYAHKDGIDYMTEADRYSIGTYAYNQLSKTGASATLQAVCAELLRYGSKSQVFKGYRTDALVDAAMTEEQKAILVPLESVSFGSCNRVLKDLSDATVTWAGVGLDLQSKVSVRMVLDLSQYEGAPEDLTVRLSYTDITGQTITTTVSDCTVYSAEKNFYAFTFSGLRAAELRTILSAAAYQGDTQVSPTLQYSVDTYGKNKKGDLLATCQALIAYADAAHAYLVG